LFGIIQKIAWDIRRPRTVDGHINIDRRRPIVFFDFPEVFHEELACLSRLRVTSYAAQFPDHFQAAVVNVQDDDVLVALGN
jgi:hypothetical protein